jgi:Myb-like DNA-binding protein FlbD
MEVYAPTYGMSPYSSHQHPSESVVSQAEQQPSQKKGPWNASEDDLLLKCIAANGVKDPNWVEISKKMRGTRSAKQCRERYHQNLKPGLNNSPISPEEGDLITRLVEHMGTKWAEIARKMPGRSDNQIKNWYNGQNNRKNPNRRTVRRNSLYSNSGEEFRLHATHNRHSPSRPFPTARRGSAYSDDANYCYPSYLHRPRNDDYRIQKREPLAHRRPRAAAALTVPVGALPRLFSTGLPSPIERECSSRSLSLPPPGDVELAPVNAERVWSQSPGTSPRLPSFRDFVDGVSQPSSPVWSEPPQRQLPTAPSSPASGTVQEVQQTLSRKEKVSINALLS